ncbi:D-alanine-D-alanine ligase [Polynucleobacter sphagniphilus]|uniref:D-alanine--D-alanine ligase n=2 Tax=Polynucleobacter sphagniphilus TaxID=1743169 RepID=A0AA43MBY3_9BURK|nr:D-alanine-D-alanine ligase [Polynucleobacter sphagniphilus]MDH6153903.1 D-alanine-D-alanine ligase [Polynucleobacter sphagniphilus]MDH6242081.1 D-alanine-D-alanine ligase [Polynucleobacter sphagniphilus]MDH6302021.1 D-alanine-D-alanine ligase [Polynucleobacter sphagniphilus]MDH6421067.1 D-alanine-D-alanine ligase [Polynucleobacter sphagniphilus]
MSNLPSSMKSWGERVKEDLAKLDIQALGRVGVLLGGRSGEREISLMSGNGVLEALLSKGVNAHAFDTGLRCPTELSQEKFDRVFISLHGRYGEDGTIQGLLELLNLPYTGSGVLASALAIDKIVTKQIWLSNHLSTPQYEELTAKSDWNAVAQHLGLPLIVKPANEGSSLGLTKVRTVEELPAAYQLAAGLDKKVIAETCIIGDELTCPIVGEGENAEALPVIKIVPPEANYDFHHKYFSDETKYLCPTGLAPEVNLAVQELVVAAYRALGCRTWGRADVMLDQKTGKPYLLEMNTSPGMTSHSLVPMAAKASGVEYADLVLWILGTTLKNKVGAK